MGNEREFYLLRRILDIGKQIQKREEVKRRILLNRLQRLTEEEGASKATARMDQLLRGENRDS